MLNSNILKQLVGAISIVVALLISIPLGAECHQVSHEQVATLRKIQTNLSVVKDLADNQIITPAEATRAVDLYTNESTAILGYRATAEQISSMVAADKNAHGFGAFLNTMIVLAGIFSLLAVVGLIGYYLRDFLKSLPSWFYECAAYLVTAEFLFAGFWHPVPIMNVDIQPAWFVIPAAFAFAGCVNLTYLLHFSPKPESVAVRHNQPAPKDRVHAGPIGLVYPQVLFGFCSLVWGTFAVIYQHALPNTATPHFLAFIAVMAFQSFLGFSVITVPGCVALGWETQKKVPRSTFASFIILTAYVAIKLCGEAVPPEVTLFEPGCLFMGAFVYFLGLLVISNKWYTSKEKERKRYLILQAITIASGVAAFYLGNTFQIGSLLGIGGTFFSIYLLEKYYEIPWKGVGVFWSLLGVAVALYFFVGFAGAHPQYFIWGMHA